MVPGLEWDDDRGGEFPCRGDMGGELGSDGGLIGLEGDVLLDDLEFGGKGNVGMYLCGVSEKHSCRVPGPV